ncbi:ATP-binding protein [Candidatus Bandiella euplotis]|uniref:ATP-binding protein n=1 Tax=Candidatus Bandiella euplotis TaxID=1664265 RepID=A0ABZ0UKA2_9RICK|nr:ATP-binding protein [Candidatus Bandiella woodruffii]WPX96372.1 ATP-binding protein [Candidatus Bandiella woodruffii]
MKRENFLQMISDGFLVNPIVAILGPRQSGKTTLTRQYINTIKTEKPIHYFDLEDPNDLAALKSPKAVLENLKGLIVIDEVQRVKELFPVLRVLVDVVNLKQQYLILGSASQELIKQSSETLAGRIEYIELPPFQYCEVKNLEKLWIRGGFPRSFLSVNDSSSYRWRESYIRTFLERDIPNLGIKIPAENIRRFWMMLANNHGGILNASDIGKSLSISHTTVRHYLDILVATFMVRQLYPWFENISKRQIKSPKIYVRDSGILHNLLQIRTNRDLFNHLKLGASWEGFALEELIKHHNFRSQDCYFWSTQNKAEIDLFTINHGKRIAYEFKFTDSPKITPSMRIAIEDLKLDELYVLCPGNKKYQIEDKIIFCGLEKYLESY